MFTGITTDTTRIKRSTSTDEGLLVTFVRPAGWQDLQVGESIATNGVCLTVAAIRTNEYDCLLVPETLQKTTFGGELPAIVNLERSLAVGDRLGGHFVQGHVDGVGTVSRIDRNDGYRLYIDFGKQDKNLVIPKGSIAIDGVSLTVAEVSGHDLAVALIPHTVQHTGLGKLKVGDSVNLEFDMIGKYIVKMKQEA